MEMTVTALLGSRAGLDDGKLLILPDRVACKIQQMERWKLLGDNWGGRESYREFNLSR